ncbi:carboxypeptidase-like regulatory domain-containing protein [Negadavirga shengliensis]|uniref:Carboxypeptidase-like regulatory domain-containing protein n=1 Tax=Negadavirga shengliensis TaxID=1389218 RepID=A0ABV9T8U2_9BACT
MRQKIFVVWLLIHAISPSGRSQEEGYWLKGRLMDKNSQKPVESAHILGPKQQAVSDSNGYFSIWISGPTQLQISHIGYTKQTTEINSKPKEVMVIKLEPAETELDPFTIRALPEEDQFKQIIIQTPPPVNREAAMAANNLDYIKKIHHLGYMHDLNSYDTFFKNIKSPYEVSFFSTNPSIGLLQVIKVLKRGSAVPSKSNASGQSPRGSYIPTCIIGIRAAIGGTLKTKNEPLKKIICRRVELTSIDTF